MLDIEEHYALIERIYYGRYAAGVVASGGDPEDVLQSILLSLHIRNMGANPYDPERSSPSTYIYAVCKSVAMNQHDKRVRRWWEVEGVEQDAALEQAGSSSPAYSRLDIEGVADLAGLDAATVQLVIDGELDADDLQSLRDEEYDQSLLLAFA